jgi:hypothetical protein
MSSYKKPSNYTSIPVTCSTSGEPLKTSKIDRIKQSPWRPATLGLNLLEGKVTYQLTSCNIANIIANLASRHQLRLINLTFACFARVFLV